MFSTQDVIQSINDAFPFFSYGERYINEFLSRAPYETYSVDGVKRQWELIDRLTNNVSEFLRGRYPAMSELERATYCEWRMRPLQDTIQRNEGMYRCYREIENRRVHHPSRFCEGCEGTDLNPGACTNAENILSPAHND
jgi:hypothetical protein